jgi:hypothetical protein
MDFIPFYEECPIVADKQTRTTFILDKKLYGIPAGQYAFIENYCTDPECDCRKVMVNIIRVNNKSGKILGTISYGWEGLKFYTQWLYGDKKLAKEMKGPSLELGGIQSEYSAQCLTMFKEVGLHDFTFLQRLPEHYTLFKKAIREKGVNTTVRIAKFDRNAPCPCGSGKKFKKCCGE